MTTRAYRLLPLALALLAACDTERVTAPEAAGHHHSAAVVPAARSGAVGLPAAELAAARAGTARYHRLDVARDELFEDIEVVIPGMGHHFLKRGRLDATFDPSEPEILVYAPDANGRMRLVAVEYAVPMDLAATPPEGFTGAADEWDDNTDFGLWTLHAWVWLDNPDGLFEPLNPRVVF